VVVRHGERAALRVNLAAALDPATLSWRLIEETGAVHTGALAPALLPDTVSADFSGTLLVARDFVLPLLPPPGYHRLAIHTADAALAETLLVVAPATCYRPPALDDNGRVWGSAVQLYALRSARNWGIGDFTDLSALANQWAACGAGVVGVNPLHALFSQCPAQASPYSPSSRLFLNILYLDVEAIADFRECEEARALVRSADFQTAVDRLRRAELVDYPGVSACKRRVLALLYAHFRAVHLAAGDKRAQAFRAFCAHGGEGLRHHALFEALDEHFFRDDASLCGWPAWPEAFRDPHSHAVEGFAATHEERVEYYQYLQ